jgi:methylated-DNA-[protein]-cysteine S-methyltransferase
MPAATPPESISFDRIPTPLGEAVIMWDSGSNLRMFDWADNEPRISRLLSRTYGSVELKSAAAPEPLKRAFSAYFDGDLASLSAIACATGGTPFQRAVWAGLRAIPPGATLSYGALAKSLGKPAAMRAVGLANGANPISLVIPCHRVIGADGSLTGYAGGMERKRWLLRHEGVISTGSTDAQRGDHFPRCAS